MELSRSQIDKLGSRLRRAGIPDDADLTMLDAYKRSFLPAAEQVARIVSTATGLTPAVRPLKTSRAIIAKLRRRPIGLAIIQDIAGCRIVVSDLAEQDRLVEEVARALPVVIRVDDLRVKPSWGYRAVHVIGEIEGRRVEVQIRTEIQHLWAQISERTAQRFGMDLKYGGGPDKVRNVLAALAEEAERGEIAHDRLLADDPDRARLKMILSGSLTTMLQAVAWYDLGQ